MARQAPIHAVVAMFAWHTAHKRQFSCGIFKSIAISESILLGTNALPAGSRGDMFESESTTKLPLVVEVKCQQRATTRARTHDCSISEATK